MTHLDLFSGIGGFALAARMVGGIQTIGFSEIEPYACRVLEKNFPGVKNYGDIRNVNAVSADLITGGFPCQPFSVAGKRGGTDDDRHLWPEMLRVITESRPSWVLGENVAGFISMELDACLSGLEAIGYEAQAVIIPAVGVDAPHRRDRVWIIGYTDKDSQPAGSKYAEEPGVLPLANASGRRCGGEREREMEFEGRAEAFSAGQDMGNTKSVQRNDPSIATPREHQRSQRTARGPGCSLPYDDCKRLQEQRGGKSDKKAIFDTSQRSCRWLTEPGVGRGLDGLPKELDRIGLSYEAEKRAGQILRELRSFIGEEEIQRTIGGFPGISKEEFLLAYLCQYEEQQDNRRMEEDRKDKARRCLRGLWRNIESARASLRPRCEKQFAREFANALCQLPHFPSSCYQEAWRSGVWEDAVKRTTNGIPHRVDRLRGLGNAIVPQVAAQILRLMKEEN